MIASTDVTAVLVTRGDCDLPPIFQDLYSVFTNVIEWNSGTGAPDRKVYGRYLGALQARTRWIYVIDDDCVVDHTKVLAEAEPGKVTCNMPADFQAAYKGRIKLVGFGAVFERRLIDFSRYTAKWPMDAIFERECDRVFTYLNDCKVVDIGVVRLPCGWDSSRLWRQKDHGAAFNEIRTRLEGL